MQKKLCKKIALLRSKVRGMFLLGGRLSLAARGLLPQQPGIQVVHQRPRYAECGRLFFEPAKASRCTRLWHSGIVNCQNRSEFLLLSF